MLNFSIAGCPCSVIGHRQNRGIGALYRMTFDVFKYQWHAKARFCAFAGDAAMCVVAW